MTQSKYVCDLLHKTQMAEAHSISSPMVSNCKLSKYGVDLFHDPTLYKSVVGALQYATLIRPEISFAVNKVCQYMASPLDSHWVVVKSSVIKKRLWLGQTRFANSSENEI